MTTLRIAEDFAALEARISEERGGFTLFALVLREGIPDRWDLVVGAPWTGDQQSVVKYLVDQIVSQFGNERLIQLARIVVVDHDSETVEALNDAIQVEHGRVEMRDTSFLGLPIKHAYVITSKRRPAPAAA
jgi:hypothetical protein